MKKRNASYAFRLDMVLARMRDVEGIGIIAIMSDKSLVSPKVSGPLWSPSTPANHPFPSISLRIFNVLVIVLFRVFYGEDIHLLSP